MDKALLDAYERLTPLQQRAMSFLDQGYSPKEAYIAAGGEAGTDRVIASCANQLMSNKNVAEYRRILNGKAVDASVMTVTEMRRRLSGIARAGIHKVASVRKKLMGYDDEGNEVYRTEVVYEDFNDIDEDVLGAISEISQKEHGITIKMQSGLAAMKQLAELEGMEAPKRTEITGAGGTAIAITSVDPNEASRQYMEMLG